MRKLRPYIVTILVLGLLIFVKIKFFSPEKPKGFGGAPGQKPVTPVTTYIVSDNKLDEKLYANGTILANEVVELRTETSGRAVYVNLPEGRKVAANTLLLKINDAEFKAQLEKVKTQLKLSRETINRQKKLVEIQGISQQEYENLLSNIEVLKSDSTYIQTQIAKTEIYAPFTGIIGVNNISKGSYLTPNTLLAVLHQIDPVKIEFSLPEKYAYFFKVGDAISFKAESNSEPFKAKISVKDPSVDLNNRSIRFHALTSNPREILLPGAFAGIELVLNQNNNTLFIPTEAIVPVASGKKVFIIKNGLAKDTIISTGIRTEDHIQVLSGLSVGDSVIINGNFQVKKGFPVKVVNAK